MWSVSSLMQPHTKNQLSRLFPMAFIKVIKNICHDMGNQEDTIFGSQRSVAGLVIQATERTEFEDGLRPGSPGGVLSDNPSVRTSSLVTPVL